MAFAVTQANRWSADEEDGRQELVLATPQSRLTVLLARFGALTTATVIMGVLTLAAAVLASAASGLSLDGGNLAAATLSIIPLGLLMAALGYLLSGWLRTAIDTGLLSFLLVIWFFISFVGPGLNWSDTTLRLVLPHHDPENGETHAWSRDETDRFRSPCPRKSLSARKPEQHKQLFYQADCSPALDGNGRLCQPVNC
jgi:putative exporter of polyketide antibiotics